MKGVASEFGCCLFEIPFNTGFYSAGWLEDIGELVDLPKETISQRKFYLYLTVKASTLWSSVKIASKCQWVTDGCA